MTTSQIVEQHREACRRQNYVFFETGEDNLNIHAIRNDQFFDNGFTDQLRIIYRRNGQWQVFESKFTTLAGTKGHGGEQRPLTGAETGTGVSGVAIIIPSQYRRVYKFVDNYWQWLAYPFFQQIDNMLYWRDNNRNGVVDKGKIYTGNYGTNLHRMGNNNQEKDWVNSETEWWSQGCHGAPEPQFRGILPIVRRAVPKYGDVFSYTLFDAEQMPK
jgi:hypothetical protein